MNPTLLARHECAGPYRLAGAEKTDALQLAAEALGFSVCRWTLTANLADDWSNLATQIPFPAHFGGNFDALFDCLCDREVVTCQGFLLLIDTPEHWPEEPRDTLIAVLQAVSDEWREQGRAFWAVFNSSRLDIDPLPQ